ncbi:MAG: YfiR family protein [Bryobacteraceae bacterium]
MVQLLQFISWPHSAMPAGTRPLEFCVLGKEQWVPLLRQAVHGEMVNGHSIKVTPIEAAPEALICHILLLGSVMEKEWLDVVARLPILTIRGEDTGQPQGAMVNVSVASGRPRFQLDLDRARKAQIQFSAKLLQLSEVALRDSP